MLKVRKACGMSSMQIKMVIKSVTSGVRTGEMTGVRIEAEINNRNNSDVVKVQSGVSCRSGREEKQSGGRRKGGKSVIAVLGRNGRKNSGEKGIERRKRMIGVTSGSTRSAITCAINHPDETPAILMMKMDGLLYLDGMTMISFSK